MRRYRSERESGWRGEDGLEGGGEEFPPPTFSHPRLVSLSRSLARKNKNKQTGTFKLTLEFTEEYPNRPPLVKFVSKMYHPNIYADGGICLDILQKAWSPIYDVAAVLTSVQSLLSDPNPDSPANAEAARLYGENRREYNRRVKEVVERSWIEGDAGGGGGGGDGEGGGVGEGAGEEGGGGEGGGGEGGGAAAAAAATAAAAGAGAGVGAEATTATATTTTEAADGGEGAHVDAVNDASRPSGSTGAASAQEKKEEEEEEEKVGGGERAKRKRDDACDDDVDGDNKNAAPPPPPPGSS